MIVANEFFDCLPIRQFQRVDGAWRERLVGLDTDGAQLTFISAASPAPPELTLPDEAEDDDIFEISLAARDFAADICALINEQGGCALIIDYGHLQSGLCDTLQAVRDHRYWPPLASPGRADITAHVDFDALARVALEAGAVAHGPVTQGAFLEKLGIRVRMEMLCKGKTDAEAEKIRLGAERIAMPDQMGEIFKVSCFASPNLPTPAGFHD